MSKDAILVVVALGVLGLAMLYAFSGSSISNQWSAWILKAMLAAGAAFGVGMLLLGLPGAFFLEAVSGPHGLPSDSAWPLSILITQLGALLILPASLLLRVVMPSAVGWGHAAATALLTIVATLVLTIFIVGAYAPA